MLSRIADIADAHPRRLAAAVALVAVLGVILGADASNKLSAHNDFSDPGSQSTHAREQIERATGAAPTAGVLVLVRAAPASAAVAHARELLSGDRSLAAVSAPLSSAGSAAGRSSLLSATLRAGVDEHVAAVHIKELFASDSAVELGGNTIAFREVGAQASSDLGLAEALAFPLIALLALLIFRGVAALLPLAVGGTSVFAAFAALRLFNVALPLSVFALNLVIGLGLGLAVDYSLFLLSRFREELGAGREPADAVRTTMSTAGRTVIYSAVTVAVAMCSLVVFPLRFLQSMGIGGAITALIAACVALTLLPALFILLGDRLGRVRPAPAREGGWYRVAHRILRRPGLVALATAGVLLLIALPALHTHWSGVDARVLPSSASAHEVEDALEREYPQVRSAPAFLAVSAPASAGPALRAYAARLARIPDVALASAPRFLGAHTWELDVALAGEVIAPAAQRAITSMRATSSPFPAAVGGAGAEFTDQRAAIAASLPVAIAILVAGTLLALWLMTGSVVLPIMALAMNALTVGAATGLLVFIFQDGRLHGTARVQLPARDRTEQLPGARSDRIRALHRLRRVPADAHQGGARPRRGAPRGGRARAAAHRPHRDRSCDPAGCRDRRVRDLQRGLPEGDRHRRGRCGAARRVLRAHAAGARADGPARGRELVVAAVAARAARAPGDPRRSQPAGGTAGRAGGAWRRRVAAPAGGCAAEAPTRTVRAWRARASAAEQRVERDLDARSRADRGRAEACERPGAVGVRGPRDVEQRLDRAVRKREACPQPCASSLARGRW